MTTHSNRSALSIFETGIRLRRSRWQVERLVMLGELQAERRGRRLMIFVDSVDQFLATAEDA